MTHLFAIDDKTKEGKKLIEFLSALKFVKPIDKAETKTVEKSPYNPEFVAKIKKADEDIKAGRTTKIATADLWK